MITLNVKLDMSAEPCAHTTNNPLVKEPDKKGKSIYSLPPFSRVHSNDLLRRHKRIMRKRTSKKAISIFVIFQCEAKSTDTQSKREKIAKSIQIGLLSLLDFYYQIFLPPASRSRLPQLRKYNFY